jgi:hypothetical protein
VRKEHKLYLGLDRKKLTGMGLCEVNVAANVRAG